MCCRWGLGPRIAYADPWSVLANAGDDTLWIESVAVLPFPATQPTIGSPGARLSLCLSAEQLHFYSGDVLPGDTCCGENPSRDSATTTFKPLRCTAVADGCSRFHMLVFFNIANNCNKDPPSQPTDAPLPARNFRMIFPSTDHKTLNDLNIILLNIPYSFIYFFTFRWVLPLECRILTLLCPVALTNAQLP